MITDAKLRLVEDLLEQCRLGGRPLFISEAREAVRELVEAFRGSHELGDDGTWRQTPKVPITHARPRQDPAPRQGGVGAHEGFSVLAAGDVADPVVVPPHARLVGSTADVELEPEAGQC